MNVQLVLLGIRNRQAPAVSWRWRASNYPAMSIVLAAFLFVCLLATATAANLCVKPVASGKGDGSDWDNTLPASFTPVRGNTYYLAAGSYGTKTLSVADSGTARVTIKKATVADHGGISTGWLDSMAGVATWSSISINTDYWTFDGATGGGPGSWTSGFGFTFSNAAGTASYFVTLASGVTGIVVRHCDFSQIGNVDAQNTGTIGIFNNNILNNSTFEYNYFHNLGGLAFFFRHGTGNLLQYNYTGHVGGVSFFDPTLHCEVVVMWGMNDTDFRYNYFAECPSSGGIVKNDLTSTDIRIYGNVFNLNGGGLPIAANTGAAVDWTVVNNTFINPGAGPVAVATGTISGLTYKNNITFKGSVRSFLGDHDYNWLSQITGYACSMGAAAHENVITRYPSNCDLISTTTDPFVNSSGTTPEAFALTGPLAGYPGTTLSSPYNTDMLGNTRGADGVWDRGALEYSVRTRSGPSHLRIVPSK